jgi:hypothetical protein
MTPSLYEPVVVERVVEGRVGVPRRMLAARELAAVQRSAHWLTSEKHSYTSISNRIINLK